MSNVHAATITAAVNSTAEQYRRDEVRAIVAGDLDATREAPSLDAGGDTVCHVRATVTTSRGIVVSLYGYDKRDAALTAAADFFGAPVRFARATNTFGGFLSSCEVTVD